MVCLLFLYLQFLDAANSGLRVRNVEIEGNMRVPPAAIRRFVAAEPGRVYDAERP